ncbi:MAG TPA: hypothetical protein VNR18_01985 [Hyphomicrobiales bacterium]|nr:hypothetical protein [Hyphomicrobiales bacterium]
MPKLSIEENAVLKVITDHSPTPLGRRRIYELSGLEEQQTVAAVLGDLMRKGCVVGNNSEGYRLPLKSSAPAPGNTPPPAANAGDERPRLKAPPRLRPAKEQIIELLESGGRCTKDIIEALPNLAVTAVRKALTTMGQRGVLIIDKSSWPAVYRLPGVMHDAGEPAVTASVDVEPNSSTPTPDPALDAVASLADAVVDTYTTMPDGADTLAGSGFTPNPPMAGTDRVLDTLRAAVDSAQDALEDYVSLCCNQDILGGLRASRDAARQALARYQQVVPA